MSRCVINTCMGYPYTENIYTKTTENTLTTH